MKVKVKIAAVLVVILVVILSNYLIGCCFFNSGKAALAHQDYKKAAHDLEIAVSRDSNNPAYHYYFAEALYQLGDFEKSEKEFEKTVKIDPLSDLSKQAFAGIRKTQGRLSKDEHDFTNSVNDTFSGLGDNYINNVTYDGKIVRWSLTKLPLKIYFIDSSSVQGYKPYYISAVIRALDRWFRYLNGKLSYVVTNDKSQADITISFVPKINEQIDGTQKESTCGLTRHLFEKDIFKSVDMELISVDASSNSLTEQEMYLIALHEAGHALGFMGHSYDSNDVMYPIAVNNISSFRDLSLKDISTIKYLYNLDADISNVPPSAEKRNNKYDKNKIILGNVDSRLNKELQEAINYVNTVSSNQFGWTKLGDAYRNVKNYAKAIASYRRALELDPTYTPAKERLALAYAESNQDDAAITEYSGLVANDPGNINLSANLAILYLQKNQKAEAGRIVDNLIEKNPDAQNDETIQKIMHSVKNNGFSLKFF